MFRPAVGGPLGRNATPDVARPTGPGAAELAYDCAMRTWSRIGAAFGVSALLLAGCGSPGSGTPAGRNGADDKARAITGTVTVLAAASLTEAFTTLAREFEGDHPGTRIRLNFGGSSTLAQQIEGGAPADVFASANLQTMSDIRSAVRSPESIARNRLQIAVPEGNPAGVTGLADFARDELTLAACAPAVPCGVAAVSAFDAAGVTPRLDTYGNDVKSVLTAVRLGEVDAGLVYRTDVRSAPDQVDGIDVPEAPVNDYPIAMLREAPNPAAARAFVTYVRSDRGRQVLRHAGFELP